MCPKNFVRSQSWLAVWLFQKTNSQQGFLGLVLVGWNILQWIQFLIESQNLGTLSSGPYNIPRIVIAYCLNYPKILCKKCLLFRFQHFASVGNTKLVTIESGFYVSSFQMIQSLVQSKESIPARFSKTEPCSSIQYLEREREILVTFQLFEATFATRVFLLMTVAMVAWMALTRLASRVTRMARKTPMRCSRMVAMRGMVASSNCSSFTLCSCFLYSIPLKKKQCRILLLIGWMS